MEYDKSLVIDILKSLADTSMKVGTEEARQRAYAYNTAIELIEKIKVADTPQQVIDSIQIEPKSEEDLQAVTEAFFSFKDMSEEALEKFRIPVKERDFATVSNLIFPNRYRVCDYEFDQHDYDDDESTYHTSCGEFIGIGRFVEPFRYCPYCGKPIEYL